MTRRSLLSLILFVCLGATALAPATAGAVSAEHRSAQAVAKVKYPGIGIEIARLSGNQRKLKGASASFKRYVVARLDVLFEEAGSKPRCATAPTIEIRRYDSRGFAIGGEGSYGPCAGGGYAVIYKKGADGWQMILGTQDARYCQDLAYWGVPDFIGGPKCISEDGKAVRYRLKKTDTVSPEATGRRVEGIVSGYPDVPSEDVLLPAAVAQVDAIVDRKGYVNLDECVAAGDTGPIAAQLGGAPYGCAVTATYNKGTESESIMLRMDDDYLVTELVPFA